MEDEFKETDTYAGMREVIEERDILKVFVKTAGWERMVENWTEVLERLRNESELEPLGSLDDVPAQEFSKGRRAQIRLDLGWPLARLEELDDEIEQFKMRNSEDGESTE